MYGSIMDESKSQILSTMDTNSFIKDMNNESEYSFSLLLEFAADNDVAGFKQSVCHESQIKVVGLWYDRHSLSKKMVLEHRTPLMVAAKYGSIDIVKLILSLFEVDVNFSCGLDKSTALHCAASGGSFNAIDVVKLLLLAGADASATDAHGHRPVDVIVAPPSFPYLKLSLEELLKNYGSVCQWDLGASSNSLTSLSSPTDEGSSSSSTASGPILSPVACKPNNLHVSSAKKEYPVDPSLPDIKNGIYATDDFRMFSFKVQRCSRAYSHDWTECPFVHPGENARRRDPRKFHYSAEPCPDHRKGACKRGDLCEYAHGIFECWLHPAQYRTRFCKDGTSCTRRVCFFAHTSKELRHTNMSTGAAGPPPQSAAMDLAAALNLLPGSPSAISAISPSRFTAPVSPSGNDSHLSMAWPQQNIPNLHIPSNNLQASRLRTSLSAKDIPSEELNRLQDVEFQQQQLLNEMSYLSQPHHSTSSTNRPTHLKSLNLDNLVSSKVSSCQYTDTEQLNAAFVFPPSYKSAVLNQFQQQQSMLSPINTVNHPLLQASVGSSSLGRMSARINEPVSPISYQLSTLAHREKLQQQLGSLSSLGFDSKLANDLGSNDVNSWPKLECANGNVDWSVEADELGQLPKSYSTGHGGEEPDVSWVQSVLKESPSET